MDILSSIPKKFRASVAPSLVDYFGRDDLSRSEQLAGHALTYVGTPIFQKGRSRTSIDCIGLICCSVSDLGIAYKDNHAYSFTDARIYDALCKALPQAFKKVRAKTFQVGDVVALRHAKCYGHVLVVLPRGYFVHAEGHKQIARVTIGTMGPDWVERFLEIERAEFSVWRLKT